MHRQDQKWLIPLRMAAALSLGGYAWLCWAGKSPLPVLFWNEQWISDLVQVLTGMSWQEYLASPATIRFWSWVEWGLAFALSMAALSVLTTNAWPRLSATSLAVGSVIIFLFSLLYGLDKIFFWIQAPEYALQWATPLLLAAWLMQPNEERTFAWLRMAAAVTFAAHGLYAMNVAPRPENFISMTMSILHVSQHATGHFLTIVGALDCVAAAAVLFPSSRWRRAALFYMFVWGLLTTLARWAAHVHFNLPWWPQTFLSWTPEVLIRVSHFLVPMALLRRAS